MKKAILWVTVFCLLTALCGCRTQQSQTTPTEPTTATETKVEQPDTTTTASSSTEETGEEADTTTGVCSYPTQATTGKSTAKTTKKTTKKTTATTQVQLQSGGLDGKVLEEGDLMADFTVTDSKGKTHTLSKMLKEKDLVVLNFWYVNCYFCVLEFPAMSEGYSRYADRVGMVALNPYDSMDDIKAFAAKNGSLKFPMATCPETWPQAFQVQGYPTTVVVDKTGVIRYVHTGALTDVSDWTDLFEEYL